MPCIKSFVCVCVSVSKKTQSERHFYDRKFAKPFIPLQSRSSFAYIFSLCAHSYMDEKLHNIAFLFSHNIRTCR